MKKTEPFELKHTNRRSGCLACEKQYLFTIKTLEKRIEVLTEMLRMEHLAKPIIFEVPKGVKPL